MGIQGLLPFLANSTRDAHISEFENQYVAVDAYCWLHKGIYSCSYEVAMKKPTTKYVTYCMRFIEMLCHFKVKPILVFDGRNLSSKEETERKRREERARKYKKGIELIRAGKISEGRQLVGESVDVRHDLVVNLMKECRKMNVDCIVAPYEADAQLSFFSLQKIVGCIITEDSDLLAYGCEKVLFKMDKSGRGKLVERSNLFMSLGMEPDEFSEEKFRYMCILSGCDYLPSLPSIGPANALKFVKLINDKDIFEVLPRLPIYLNKTKVTVNSEYLNGFKMANNTFQHQLVYDPFHRQQVPLKPVENDDEIVGEKLSDDEAFQLAVGNVDPITMAKMDNFNPDKNSQGHDILWKSDLSRKEPLFNFNSLPNGTCKRQSEVALVKHDLKKYCPSEALWNNQAQKRKPVNRISQTGFVFNTQAMKNNSEVLKSRYFRAKENPRNEVKRSNSANPDRRKDESYEDYLQRLYEEHLSDDENDLENAPNNHLIVKNNINDVNIRDVTKHVDTCVSDFERSDIVNNKIIRHQSLLDELSRTEESGESRKKIESLKAENELQNSKVFIFTQQINSLAKDLPCVPASSLNSSAELSLTNSSPIKEDNNDEEKINENENETEFFQIDKVVQRSPSPVFKVSNRTKVTNEFLTPENVDTTCTPTSVYFSGRQNAYLKEAWPGKTSITPKRKSLTSLPVKTNKSTHKELTSSRTLFQFGFKKASKDEVSDVS